MTRYHPKDTADILKGKESGLDHLHYKVHYFQVENHKEENGLDRNKPVSNEIGLSSEQKKVMKQGKEQREYALGILTANHFVRGFKARINGRMMHGMGEAHVRETSITIHPVYGIPYIPSSSIKGALRNWAIQALFAGSEPEEDKEEKSIEEKLHFTIFGSQQERGQVVFYDAFADEKTIIRPDVLTVHFPKYYNGSEPPTDDQNPNPVNFYTVEEAYFDFYISIAANMRLPENFCREELAEFIIEWLKAMLKQQGIGSKTASGYGRFERFIPKEPKDLINKVVDFNEKMGVSQLPVELMNGETNSAEAEGSLLERVQGLTDSKEDQERSKQELFNELKELPQEEAEDIRKAAEALKRYWIANSLWLDTSDEKKLKKNKNAKRTKELKELLS